MKTDLKFYFSINDLLKDELLTLINNDSFNSYKEYKTLLWSDNNVIIGNIIYKIEIKNSNEFINSSIDYNFNSCGIINIEINNNLSLNENIIFELPIFNNGNKINIFTNNYNIIVDYFYINNIKIENKFEIIIEPFINEKNNNDELFYGLIIIKNNI